MNVWMLLLAALCLSLLLTSLLRRYALSRSLIDIPNDRSSHQVPTPRGGGVAIVLTFLLCLVVLWAFGSLPMHMLIAAGVSGAGVALIGFLDDHGHIAARWRLLAHLAAASWAIGWLGGLSTLHLFGVELDLGWFGWVLALLYLVWLLNLYNFMDGIDGIAGVEAITVSLSGALLFWVVVPEPAAWQIPLVLAATVAGFLYWNFPVAKIFMGDAGSGFLGVMLGLLSLYAFALSPELLWSWLILLGVFIVDATLTLLRRVLRGEKFYQAHRSHAYQYASRLFASHARVTVGVAAINLFWLLPIAWLVATQAVDGVLGILLAYAPLVGVALKFQAGSSSQAV